MEINNIQRLGPLLSSGLNTEEISGLEVATLQRKLEENLSGKMYFWGKIYGTTQDYFVVFNINPYDEFPVKKYYFRSFIFIFNFKNLFIILLTALRLSTH